MIAFWYATILSHLRGIHVSIVGEDVFQVNRLVHPSRVCPGSEGSETGGPPSLLIARSYVHILVDTHPGLGTNFGHPPQPFPARVYSVLPSEQK